MAEIQSGIYGIRCIPTSKLYVGSSVDIHARWNQHRALLRQGEHRNTHLQNAWNEYGEEAFAFEVLEIVERESLLDREQHWIDETKCHDREHGYNILPATSRGKRAAGVGVYLHGQTPDQTADLREAAEVLGFLVSRGPGVGQGSMAAMMATLSDKYREQPDRVLHFLSLALGDRPWKLPNKYRSHIPIDDYSDAD